MKKLKLNDFWVEELWGFWATIGAILLGLTLGLYINGGWAIGPTLTLIIGTFLLLFFSWKKAEKRFDNYKKDNLIEIKRKGRPFEI